MGYDLAVIGSGAAAFAAAITARTADCGTECGSWERMCPHTTFHASRDSAQA